MLICPKCKTEPTVTSEKCTCGERFVFIRPEKKEEVFLAYKEGGINAVEEVILGGVKKKILYCPDCTKKWDPTAAACVCGHKNIYKDYDSIKTEALANQFALKIWSAALTLFYVVVFLLLFAAAVLGGSIVSKVLFGIALIFLVNYLLEFPWFSHLVKGILSFFSHLLDGLSKLLEGLFKLVEELDGMFGKILGVFSIIVGILLTLTGLGALVGIPLIAAGCVFYFAGIIGGVLTFIALSFIMSHSS